MSSRPEVIEQLVAPLYLSVSGSEIDRLRQQLTSLFNVEFEDIPPGIFLVCVGDVNHHIVFGMDWDNVESAIVGRPFLDIAEGLPLSVLAGVAHSAHEDYYKKERRSSEEERAQSLDLIGCLLLHMAKMEKSTDRRPNSRLLIMNLSYRKLDGEQGLLFSTTWKRQTTLPPD